MSYAKGCRRETGHRYTSFEVAKMRGMTSATLPTSVDLSRFAPPVMNQTEFSCCEGVSTVGAIATAFAAAGDPLPWLPSPAGIYALARCLARSSPAERLTDSGTETNAVIRAITEFGIRPIGEAPGGTFCDVTKSNVNSEPLLSDLEQDALNLLVGAYQIHSLGQLRITDMKIALASGFAVRVDTDVDQAFEDWIPSKGPYGAPDHMNSLGGHAMYCIGYSGDTFTIRNSWGTDWCDSGNITVDARFINAADCYAWNVKRAAQ